MSDIGGPVGDDDVGLPKATVFKLISGMSVLLYTISSSQLPGYLVEGSKLTTTLEMLPEDIACSKEAKDIIVECCVGWFSLHPFRVYTTTMSVQNG